LAGVAGRNTKKYVGDYVRLHNGNRHNHISAFMENKYKTETVNLFLSGLVMLNAYQRWDKYNYIDDIYSDIPVGWGGNIKTGIGYKFAEYHTVYLNGGWNTKVPYPSFYFPNGTNELNKNVKNEQAYLGEAGYTLQMYKTRLNVSGYYNYWKNKSLMSNLYKQNNESLPIFMISGLDAQHIGGELILEQKVTYWFSLFTFASVGDWRWKNDVNALIKDEYTDTVIKTIKVFSKNLYVGDAPQTQIGIAPQIKILKNFLFRIEWRYTDRMYADFDPSKRTDSKDKSQSYRIPAYHIVDFHFGYDLKFEKTVINFYASLNNAFDAFYIERGNDGIEHNLETFRGFWGAGRTFSYGVKIKF